MSELKHKKQLLPTIDIISFKITNIKGKKIDVTQMFLSLTIYESIFDYFLHGQCVLIDTMDLQKNFPIIGNEDIDIQVRTDDSEAGKTLKFKIYKLNGDPEVTKQTNTNKKILVLYFCSPERLINERTTYSKKYIGKPEALVQTILTDNLQTTKTLTSETGTSSVTVFSNYWKSSKIIDFISRISRTSKYSDYIFYETIDGFIFKTISELMSQEPIQDFVFEEGIETLAKTNNMKAFKFENYFDIVRSSFDAQFGLTQYKPHETNYSYTKTETTLSNTLTNIHAIGINSFFNNELFEKTNKVMVNHYDPDISKTRPQSIQLVDNYKLVVNLSGDLERTVGDVVKIRYKAYDTGFVDLDNYEEKYIIGRIKHQIYRTGRYEQNLMLLKNTFASNTKTEEVNNIVNEVPVEEAIPTFIKYGTTTKTTGFTQADYDGLTNDVNTDNNTQIWNSVSLTNQYWVMMIPVRLGVPSNFYDYSTGFKLLVEQAGIVNVTNSNGLTEPNYVIKTSNLITDSGLKVQTL